MSSLASRRRFVQLLGLSAGIGLAGCLGDGDDDTDDITGEEGNGEDTGQPTGDDPAEPADPGDPDDGEEQEDPDDGEEQEDTDEESEPGDGTGDSPRLRDVATWEDSFVMEFEDDQGSGTWTFYEGDSWMVWGDDGEPMETYQIDNTHYTVTNGQCFKSTGGGGGFEPFDPEEPVEDAEEFFATGTTTLDGEEAYIFDVGTGFYYVSVATGYPVRFEDADGNGVVTLHSWGNTSPITPPEMDCFER